MKEKLKFIFSHVWTFLAPKIRFLLTEAGKVAVRIALESVRAAMLQNVSSKERREYAIEYAKNKLATEGVTVGASMLNSLIEDAYQSIK